MKPIETMTDLAAWLRDNRCVQIRIECVNDGYLVGVRTRTRTADGAYTYIGGDSDLAKAIVNAIAAFEQRDERKRLS